MKLKVIKDYYLPGKKIYKFNQIDFNTGITILIGCNGAGKSTLLKQLQEQCLRKKVNCLYFDNYRDGGLANINKLFLGGDINDINKALTSSEGETINRFLEIFTEKIAKSINACKKDEPLVILFDAIDSGLSIDGILDVRSLFEMIREDCKDKQIPVYIIASANEFELARENKCLNVSTGREQIIKDYETFKKEILDSYKNKLIREQEKEA